MDFLKGILTDELFGQLLKAVLSGGQLKFDTIINIAEKLFRQLVQNSAGFIVLISIPALILAAAYCFFGVKIYRVLLVLSSALGGGSTGSLLLGWILLKNGLGSGGLDKIAGAIGAASAGAVIGFILFAAIFGVLAWFFYKIFLFIEAFVSGLFTTCGILYFITNKNVGLSVGIGIIVGLAFAVMVCIYARLFIMITTAYKGAGKIASTLALFFIAKPVTHGVVYLLLLAGFTALGFFVQYRFFADTYNGGKKESSILAKYKLVGIEGMYKGFEFDLEDRIMFGRDVESCNVIFPDTCAGVSRIQCEIIYDNKRKSVSIVDRYSSYGTTLNGSRLEINREMPLNNGDVIMFGENNVFKLGC